MNRLLAVDPGASCGVALVDDARLVLALALHADAGPAPCAVCPICRPPLPCSHVAGRAAQLIGGLLAAVPDLREIDTAVMEQPTWWGSSTPNAPALLQLAATAGALAGCLLGHGVGRVLCVPPGVWKGRTAKTTFQRGILASLDEAERALVPRGPKTRRFDSDATDAVGLGLWAVGRLGQWRTDPASFLGMVDEAPIRSRKTKTPRHAQAALRFGVEQERR